MNTLRVSLSLSFKGENHDLSAVIDLDRCGGGADSPPDFHRLLAVASGIDTYSYLYEALESYDLEFSEPAGLAEQAFAEGEFDWPAFARLREDAADWQSVCRIAAQHLPVAELDARADLQAALLAVYRAGAR